VGLVLLKRQQPGNPRVLDGHDYPDPDRRTGFGPRENAAPALGASGEGGTPFLGVGRDTEYKLLPRPCDESVCRYPTQNGRTAPAPIGTEGKDISPRGEFDG
jgi:hypothetical protein